MTMFENENPIMPLADDGGGGISNVTLAIETINQKSFPEDNPDTSSSNSYCFATSVLAVARFYHPNNDISMTQLEKDGIVNHGNGTILSWSNKYFKCTAESYSSTSPAKVREAIRMGYPVILSNGGHAAVAYAYTGTTIKVMDPWGGVKGILGTTLLKNPTMYRICKPL